MSAEQKTLIQRFLQWKPFPENGKLPMTWSLWVEIFKKSHHKAGLSKNQFASALEKVGDFRTMNELCKLWSEHTDEQGKPVRDCNLLVFQQGVKPLWEDEANILGGHWVVRIMRNEAKAEQVWYSLLMTVICGQVTNVKPQEITGIVISPRDHLTQIYVWNRHSLNSKYKEIMNGFICKSLDVPKHWLRYNTHKKKVLQNKNPSKKDKKNRKNKKTNQNTNESEEDKDLQPTEEDLESLEDDTAQNQGNDSEEDLPTEEIDTPEEVQAEVQGDTREIQPESIEDSQFAKIVELEPKTGVPKEDFPTVVRELPAQPQGGISMFSISVGFAIFLALLYNLYILLA